MDTKSKTQQVVDEIQTETLEKFDKLELQTLFEDSLSQRMSSTSENHHGHNNHMGSGISSSHHHNHSNKSKPQQKRQDHSNSFSRLHEQQQGQNDPILQTNNNHHNNNGENENNDNDYNRKKATGMTPRRCHCNLSQCASTNYMCKSEKRIELNPDGSTTEIDAGCFIEELTIKNKSIFGSGAAGPSSSSSSGSNIGVTEANGRVTSARRGCIEMLPREKLKLCSDRTGSPVQCCFNEDMCNYPKTFYPPQFHTPNINRLNYDSNNGLRGMSPPPNLDQQVWLRAALICVPICGLMILFVLILVAKRLLKNDDDYKEERMSRIYTSPPNNKSYNNYYYAAPPPPSAQNEFPFIKSTYLPDYSEEDDEFLSPMEIVTRQQRQQQQREQQQLQLQQCCCCHNRINDNDSILSSPLPSTSSSSRHGIGRKISSGTTTSETQGLVSTQTGSMLEEPIFCQCSSSTSDFIMNNESHSEESLCSIRPPSIVFTGPTNPILTQTTTTRHDSSTSPPPCRISKKFKILSMLGFGRKEIYVNNV